VQIAFMGGGNDCEGGKGFISLMSWTGDLPIKPGKAWELATALIKGPRAAEKSRPTLTCGG